MTLPNGRSLPAGIIQKLQVAAISFDIFLEFLGPELHPGLWHISILTSRVTMPITSVNEYYRAMLGQHDIRFSGQVFSVQAKSIPHSMEQGADDHFRFCIFRPDAAHVPAAVLFAKVVQNTFSVRGTIVGS